MEENFNQLTTIIMTTNTIKEYLNNIQQNGYYEVLDAQQCFVDFLLFCQETAAANEIGSYKVSENCFPDIN
jgi:hypothetical protein